MLLQNDQKGLQSTCSAIISQIDEDNTNTTINHVILLQSRHNALVEYTVKKMHARCRHEGTQQYMSNNNNAHTQLYHVIVLNDTTVE
jgi:CRISPR/Cas system-associated endonuclease Cas1